jgi:hypothetical protein
MLAGMTAREFTEWQAYLAIDKVGPARDDWRFAQVCAAIVNMLRDPKRSRSYTIKDFMPDLRTPEERGRQEAAMRAAELEIELIRAKARTPPNGRAE